MYKIISFTLCKRKAHIIVIERLNAEIHDPEEHCSLWDRRTVAGNQDLVGGTSHWQEVLTFLTKENEE